MKEHLQIVLLVLVLLILAGVAFAPLVSAVVAP